VLRSTFQVLLNPATQDKDAVEGLRYISDLLIRCRVTEETYLGTDTAAPPALGQRHVINFLKRYNILSDHYAKLCTLSEKCVAWTVELGCGSLNTSRNTRLVSKY
jgi:hypothetical protein